MPLKQLKAAVAQFRDDAAAAVPAAHDSRSPSAAVLNRLQDMLEASIYSALSLLHTANAWDRKSGGLAAAGGKAVTDGSDALLKACTAVGSGTVEHLNLLLDAYHRASAAAEDTGDFSKAADARAQLEEGVMRRYGPVGSEAMERLIQAGGRLAGAEDR